MNDGTKTAVATLLVAIIIASSVAAVVPFIGDGEDEGVRTGHFDRFPRDFTPEEKDIGTPAESRAEAEALLERWGPVLTDPESTPEQKDEAAENLDRFGALLETRVKLFEAVYYGDVLAHASEMDEWNSVWIEYDECIWGLSGAASDPVPEEVSALKNRINDLSSQYDLVMAEKGSVVYEGVTYSVYDIYLPEEIRKPAVEKLNAELADILFEMVDCRNRLAQLHGYDSYIEYWFGEYNSDDVTPEAVKGLIRTIAPLAKRLEWISSAVNTEPAFDDFDEVLDRTGEFLDDASTDMADFLDYLRRNGLIFALLVLGLKSERPEKASIGAMAGEPGYISAIQRGGADQETHD